MTALSELSKRAEVPLLVAFADLTRFTRTVQSRADRDVAEVMAEYYEFLTERIEASGGHIVKFIGDAALIVFDESSIDPGVQALLDAKDRVDAWFSERGWPSKLVIKVHFGTAIAGPYGPPGRERFDVLGKTVNTAALLPSSGVALTPQAFRKLSQPTRTRFKKHTPPITYIRTGDPRLD